MLEVELSKETKIMCRDCALLLSATDSCAHGLSSEERNRRAEAGRCWNAAIRRISLRPISRTETGLWLFEDEENSK